MKLKIIKKIKKIMRLRESALALGNVHEAERCLDKIADLRARYQITAEIPLEEYASPSAKTVRGVPAFDRASLLFRKKRIFWEEVVFASGCRFFDCQPLVFARSNFKVAQGTDYEDCLRAVNSYLFYYKKANELADQFLKNLKKENGKDFDKAAARLARQSFLHGFSDCLNHKLAYIYLTERHLEEVARQGARLAPASGDATPNDRKLNAASVSRDAMVKPPGELPADAGECTALVKSDRIVITEQRSENADEKTAPPKDAAPPAIKEMDFASFNRGADAANETDFSPEVKIRVDLLTEQLEKMRRAEEEKRAAEILRRRAETGPVFQSLLGIDFW